MSTLPWMVWRRLSKTSSITSSEHFYYYFFIFKFSKKIDNYKSKIIDNRQAQALHRLRRGHGSECDDALCCTYFNIYYP